MTAPRIVGLDLSLRATGIAGADTGGPITLHTKHTGLERLVTLRDAILRTTSVAALVVIEDYAFSRANAHAHALGELGGVVKVALHEAHIPTVLISPSAVKKFATNKGNANKIEMARCAERDGYTGPSDDNCIDAWWLHHLGLYAVTDQSPLDRTAYRDETVAKIAWPTLPVTAS